MARLHPFVFENRDPWPTEIPGYFSEQFRYILKRTQEILNGRSPEQIRYIYDTILWLNDEQEKRAIAEAPSDGSPTIIGRSPAYDLLHCLDWVELKEQDFLPNDTWLDYFAVQALSLIHHALLLLSDQSNYAQYENPADANWMRLLHVAELAIQATEAITMADMLEREPDVVDDRHRQKSRGAGIAKGAETKPLKARVFHRYDELLSQNKKISDRKAANIILKEVPQADLAVLTGDDPQHRFQVWISEYKRLKIAMENSLFKRIIILK